MAKKKSSAPIKTGSHNVPAKPAAAPVATSPHAIAASTQLLIAGIIGAVTWLCLKVCLDNQYTHWDDDGYITNNQLIRDLSGQGISNMFSVSNHVMGNYHPLTVLSNALEYSKVGLEPYLYHFDNLLLHVCNTLLVYWLVSLLTRRPVAAAITALLFGLHPMHVEPVAWLAGRKDVLYGSFYLAACIAHIYYLRSSEAKKWPWYTGVLLLFICALLSKPVAVVLPLSLLAIDLFEQTKWKLNRLTEKIPHFIIALIFGVIAVHNQGKFHALFVKDLQYNFIERIALGNYALLTYLWKAVAPLHLCCFYQYPVKENGWISMLYFLCPVVVAGLVYVCRKYGRSNRYIVFGLLFFIVNVLLLLQFVPVGGAIVADRYTYIAYTGLFFIAGWWVSGYFEAGGNKQTGYVITAVLAVYLCTLGYLSNERCKVWYNSCTLWRDEIDKQPFASANEYNNLAFYYFGKFTDATVPAERKLAYDSAYYLINVAIKLQPDMVNAYIGLGDLEMNNNQPEEAKKNFYKALELKGESFYFFAYQKLALIYAMSNKYDSSAYFFKAAIGQNPNVAIIHTNYGKLLGVMNRPDAAMKEFATAITLDKNNYAPFFERAYLCMRANQFQQALNDLNEAIKLNPESGICYYYRGLCYVQTGNTAQGQQDMQKAKALGYNG